MHCFSSFLSHNMQCDKFYDKSMQNPDCATEKHSELHFSIGLVFPFYGQENVQHKFLSVLNGYLKLSTQKRK